MMLWAIAALVLMALLLGVVWTTLVGYLWWSRRRFERLKEQMSLLLVTADKADEQHRQSVVRLTQAIRLVAREIHERTGAPQAPPETPAQDTGEEQMMHGLDGMDGVPRTNADALPAPPPRLTAWARLRENIQDV